MSKLKLIFKREYLTRVRKTSFIVGTLLAPLLLLVYMLVIVGLSTYQGGEALNVAVLDEGKMIGQLPDEKGVRFQTPQGKTLAQLKQEALDGKYDGILQVPAITSLDYKNLSLYYHSDKKLAPEAKERIESRISKKVRDFKIDSLKLERKKLEALDTKISIDPEKITPGGEDQSEFTVGIGLAIGGIMSFIMFFMMTMYGQMVMRSVMEEKTNRIVEVIMSSVKPFQLMLGKILGAGAVGLTQVFVWIVLSGAVWFIMMPFVAGSGDPAQMQDAMQQAQASGMDPEEAQSMGFKLIEELQRQNWWALAGAFVVFFLGGYFIYSSLFAAVGSAMSDDMGESQSLVLPIMLPIMLAFYLIAFAGWRNPDSGLMVFASLFPLTSPIVMPFRMAFNPPMWQVILSLLLVVGSAFFFVWLSGRIYRVGILLYGKKVTFKEIGKWLFYKS